MYYRYCCSSTSKYSKLHGLYILNFSSINFKALIFLSNNEMWNLTIRIINLIYYNSHPLNTAVYKTSTNQTSIKYFSNSSNARLNVINVVILNVIHFFIRWLIQQSTSDYVQCGKVYTILLMTRHLGKMFCQYLLVVVFMFDAMNRKDTTDQSWIGCSWIIVKIE